jgi:hypothetical protein
MNELLSDLALKAQGYQQLHESGQLSDADFKELINDLQIEQTIQNSAAEDEQTQMYHQILMGALAIAEALG